MWVVNGTDLSMAEGDYGLTLPITISGTTLTENDRIKLAVKRTRNGALVVEKTMTPTENTVDFVLSRADSDLLKAGAYVYALDWFQDGNFLCSIIPDGNFKVVDKA